MTRLGLLVCACLVFLASPAHAQESSGIEQIHVYDLEATIEDDGDLLVTETIAYDFGFAERHGITRTIPTRYRYDDDHDRVVRLSGVDVRSETAPSQVSLEGDLIRIGDPDRTISGRHTYEISYRLEGALNAFDDHVELYWTAIGQDWAVPITSARATVTGPATIDRVGCFTGPFGSSLPCESATADGRTAGFTESHLDPFETLTVVVSLPPGSVTATGPILEEIWNPARAFSTTPATVGSTFGLLGAIVAGLGVLVWKIGRDRRAVGGAVEAAFGEGDTHERVPLFGGYDGPVQVEPPDGMRPGQVGTLIDERANALDVTATVVDLAVRGYLRIEEVPKDKGISGWFDKPDWKLHKLRDHEGLLHYEELLFNSLFKGGDVVELSSLKNTFAKRLEQVQQALYADAIKQGWFPRSPESTRARWRIAGFFVAAAGVALTVVFAKFTSLGIVPLPVIVGGLMLMVLAGRMPHRTAAGTGAYIRTLGFKQFIDDSERDRARFAEQQHLFTEYLPYAVVFGATEKWAKAFAGLDGQLPDQSSWYVGPHGHLFTMAAFSSSMDGFATTTAGTIASTPSSSGTSGFGGGGFSGGGVGGGGGGSW